MLTLSAKIRKSLKKKAKVLRENDILPAVLYGPKVKNPVSLEINLKEFEKIYKEVGGSSLISLDIEGKQCPVLIQEVANDPLTDKFIHVDFYQPRLDEEIEAKVPLAFEGEAPACKELGGTLVKNIHEVEVKALPQNLLHEIKVNVEGLKTFEDNILIKDLNVSKDVKILKDPEETVAFVAEPEKVEEELEKPVEEKVEEVEKVEEGKEKEEIKEEKEEAKEEGPEKPK